MTPTERHRFATWQRRLLACVEAEPVSCGTGGCMVDAAVPFRLGWTPRRAALALLGINHRDAQILRGIMMEKENP